MTRALDCQPKRIIALGLTLAALIVPIGCNRANVENDENSAEIEAEDVAPTLDYSLAQPIELEELTSERDCSAFIENNEIAVIKFGATWCPPCRKLDPELQKIAGYFQVSNVAIALVDVDDLPALAQKLAITSIPDTRFFYNGRAYTRIVGYEPQAIAKLIESMCQGEIEDLDSEPNANEEENLEEFEKEVWPEDEEQVAPNE
ncbi:MAG: thioredoxin family protein [Planctomycetia bacterium]|nr:thioredoxin family protein [Planctomycetia bacterium]